MAQNRLANRSRGFGEIGVVRIRLLGGFSVSVGARVIAANEWRRRKAGSLVKMLAMTDGHRLHREAVAALLWPSLDAKSAFNNLHRAIHFARRALHPAEISLRDGLLSLCPGSSLWVDVEAFEEAAKIARNTRETSAYHAATELYAGELLPEDRYEEWAEERRGELRNLYVSLLFEVAALHEEREEYDPAVEALWKAVSEKSSREDIHLALMRLFALRGERERAISQYRKLEEVLGDLGAKPSEASRQLHEEISGRRFPKKPLESRAFGERSEARHNLAHPRASFVGREHEMVEIRRSLSMTRLLTLTGAGGCGKTRLAVEVARSLLGSYPNGVWMARFAPVSDESLVPRTVAGVLGVREQPGTPLSRTISEYLRTKRALLVLDNCEHLIDAVAWLSDSLLASCGDLRILATSREALGVSGEVAWRTPTLTTPGGGDPPGDLARYEAVRLFVERSKAKLPAFDLTETNARAVGEVCRKLDGIPLAIELAAARMGALAVEQVAGKLNDSLGLLGPGSRTAEPRHKTMRATMEWSHDLLSEGEKTLFRRLSVFAGGWTLEAAEKVGGASVLDPLESLVEKSLVAADVDGDRGMRYRMLETVRQYAYEKLEGSGEAEEVRGRHAEYLLALAEEEDTEDVEFEVRGGRSVAWLERMATEQPNLRAALSWLLEGDDPSEECTEMGARLAVALFWFWQTRAYQAEGRRWTEKAASMTGDSAGIPLRARALTGVAWLAHFQSDFQTSKVRLEESLALYRELGDKAGIASGLHNLAWHAILGERDDVPLPSIIGELAELRPHVKNPVTIAYLLMLDGVVAGSQGNLERAVALHEECLEVFREMGDAQGLNTCVYHLGILTLIQADYERALPYLRENLREGWIIDQTMAALLSVYGLACVAASTGRPARAARLWGTVEGMKKTHGAHVTSITLTHTNYEGRMAEARSQIGDEPFAAAWAEGKAMPLESAVEYALGDEEEPQPAEPPESSNAPNPLTRRQREVAALVGKGLTNREIADELHLSEHTVMAHLRDIRNKLGVHSRARIAAWVFEERHEE